MSSDDLRFEHAGRWPTWRTRQALAALGVVAVLGSKITLVGMGPSWPATLVHPGLFLALVLGLQFVPRLRPYAVQLHGWLGLYIGLWSIEVAWSTGWDPMHLTVLLMGLLVIGFIYPTARGVAGFHAVMLVVLLVAMLERPPPHWTVGALVGFYGLMALVAYATAVVRDRVLRDVRELSSVADHVPQGVSILDRDGRVVWANRAMRRIGRTSPGAAFASLFAGPEGTLRVLATALGQARPVEQVQLRHVRRDGTWRWVALSMQPVAAPGGEVERFVVLEDDVTAERAYVDRLLAERAEAEGARERAEGQLRQSQKMEALGRLAGGVAHDINNVLTVILAHASLLQEDATDADRSLDAIVNAAERAADIAKRLLAFSRHRLINVRPIDVNAFVEDFARMVAALVGETIRVDLDLEPDAGSVRADVAQLDQVMLNLVVNARDAMPAGGTLRLWTRSVDVSPAEGAPALPYVRLSVSDTGAGMSAETLSRIFEPFFTTKENGRGTGLGLAIVDGAVRQLGGFVRVESAEGSGTTFHVHLPRTRPAADAGESERKGRPEGTERVLVVEDEPAVRAVAAQILRNAGYHVVDVPDAEQAVVVAEHERFDLLVTDVVLPVTSGRDLAQRLTAARRGLRVLYMSGYAPDDLPDAKFLVKPFTADSLLRCVRAALD